MTDLTFVCLTNLIMLRAYFVGMGQALAGRAARGMASSALVSASLVASTFGLAMAPQAAAQALRPEEVFSAQAKPCARAQTF